MICEKQIRLPLEHKLGNTDTKRINALRSPHFFPCVSPGPFAKARAYKRTTPGLARDILREVKLQWTARGFGTTASYGSLRMAALHPGPAQGRGSRIVPLTNAWLGRVCFVTPRANDTGGKNQTTPFQFSTPVSAGVPSKHRAAGTGKGPQPSA